MTTTTTTDATRADVAAILRAVADLIETHPDIPLPGSDISFYVCGDDAPATMAAIAADLPCQWQAEISRSGEYEWLHLRTGPASVLRGTRVSINAPAADACTEPPADRRAIDAARPRPAGSWPLPGWWQEIRPRIGGDGDEHRPR